jgi:hypothetical protein
MMPLTWERRLFLDTARPPGILEDVTFFETLVLDPGSNHEISH